MQPILGKWKASSTVDIYPKRYLIKREFFSRNNTILDWCEKRRTILFARDRIEVNESPQWWDHIGLTCDIDLCVEIWYDRKVFIPERRPAEWQEPRRIGGNPAWEMIERTTGWNGERERRLLKGRGLDPIFQSRRPTVFVFRHKPLILCQL